MAYSSILTIKDFKKIRQVDGAMTPILSYKVPRSEVLLLPSNEPLQLMVMSHFEYTATVSGPDIVKVGEPIALSAGIPDYGEVMVWNETTNQPVKVVQVDYQNGSISTGTGVSVGDKLHFFYPARGNANLHLVVVPPLGHAQLRVPVFARGMRSTHEIDQRSSYSPVLIKRAPGELGALYEGWPVNETWQIQLLTDYKKPVSGFTSGGIHHGITTSDFADGLYHIEVPVKIAGVGDFAPGLNDRMLNYVINAR